MVKAEAQPLFYSFFSRMMGLQWLGFICLTFSYQYLAEIAYTAVTKKNYNPYNSKLLLDMAIFLVFFISIVTNFHNIRDTIREGPGIVTWEEKAPIYCTNYVNNEMNEHMLLFIGDVLLWIRVVNFFKFNRFLGPMIGIIKRMIPEITLFFIVYIINLAFFSFIAEAAFTGLEEYNTWNKAFRTLFYASFGTFSFERIENCRLGINFGVSFLLLFLIINIGLFMKLFVSIITVMYQIYQKNQNIYQMIETLRVRPATQADKTYSVLISMPPPFNFLLFFLAPFVISSKNPQNINMTFLIIAYLPVLITVTLLFIIGEVIMWPFVYTKMVFHKLTMVWVYSKAFRVSRADKFAHFVYFAFFGPFITIGNSFIDLLFFLRHLMQFDL